jgi:hypothetical protein
MKKILPGALAALAFTPMISSAAALFGGFSDYIGAILKFINSLLIPAIFTLAFLVFIWGVFKAFIVGGHDSEKREEGKKLVIWSIVGFVVMLSVWGIVNLVAGSLGFQGDRLDPNAIPTFGPGGPTN